MLRFTIKYSHWIFVKSVPTSLAKLVFSCGKILFQSLAILRTAGWTAYRVDVELDVSARNDVDYVVTEYGIAWLRGLTIAERVQALTKIAHPDFRAWLLEEAEKLQLTLRLESVGIKQD